MSVSYAAEWIDAFEKAKKKSGDLGQRVLFSLVRKVDEKTDPLFFYHSGHKHFYGERFLWKNPSGEIMLAGLGVADTLKAEASGDRIREMGSRWSNQSAAAIQAGYPGVRGTGPVLFGGFTFDAQDSGSTLWHPYGKGVFYVPAILFSVIDGNGYLTINVACSPDARTDELLLRLKEGEQLLKLAGPPSEETIRLADRLEQNPVKWKNLVRKAVGAIKAAEFNKVVLARTRKLIFEERLQPESVLQRLREGNKGNYLFSLESADTCFLGATPELLVKKEKGILASACLAGSIRRGQSPEEDRQLSERLFGDPKNRREHEYVVAFIREAFGRLCSRLEVPDQPVILKNGHIQHLFTPIKGMFDSDRTIIELVGKLHPTPALGGVPAETAVRWIRENEGIDRGLYGSPIGWCDADGNGEFAVGIRSALIQGREATLFAGCGIIDDSIPEKEYEETAIKFQPMLHALGGEQP